MGTSLPQIFGDPESLKDVAVNLISNAVQYTPEGGRIEVSTGMVDNYILLRVADNGIGIAKEYQEKVFDRFFRVRDEKTRYIVGTGLGLPIVKAIVDDHLGNVLLESEPGQGSVFTVRFPVIR